MYTLIIHIFSNDLDNNLKTNFDFIYNFITIDFFVSLKMAFASSIIPPTTAHGEKAEKFIRTNFKRWQQKMLFYLTTLNLARVYIKLGIILNSYASSTSSIVWTTHYTMCIVQ